MGKPKIQKIIATVTLGAFIFTSIFLPIHQAVAGQYDPTGIDLTRYKINNSSTTPNATSPESYLSDTNTYDLNIGTIGESLSAVIGCGNIVNRVQSSFTDLLNSKGSKADTSVLGDKPKPDIAGGTDTAKAEPPKVGGAQGQDQTSGFGEASQNVPIQTDRGTASNIANTATSTKKTDEKAAQEKLREECLNGVAYSLAKQQLAKMTQITVNWINSGFNGDPLYIRDRDSYFQSLADGQLLSMVGPLASIQNQYIYPFGRQVARSLINSQKYNYETAAQSTIDRSVIDGTAPFTWSNWNKILEDKNNPLGFGIMTSQELSDRITKQQEDAKAELLEGRGFLSQKECAEYAKNDRADGGAPANPANNGTLGRECIKWKTVTPGSIIQEQASTALTSSTRQLELADSLNESLSIVFQTLVNNMISKGLQSLSSFTPQNAPKTFGGLGDNNLYDSMGNNITNLSADGSTGNVLSVKKGNGWYSAGDTFNITTDLGDIRRVANGKSYVYKQGVISIQKDYAEAVKVSLAKLPEILPKLGELDYCIPGPNPSWENPTKNTINYIIEYLQGLYFYNGAVYKPTSNPLEKSIAGQIGLFVINIVPTYRLTYNLITGNKAKYEASIKEQFEKRIAEKEQTFEKDRNEAITYEKEAFVWYKDRIDSLYGPNSPMRTPGNPWYLPMAEAGLQATKYISVYDENIATAKEDYKDLINQTNANIYKLNEIKKKVDKIVAAASKRRMMNSTGVSMADPSCYDMNTVPGGGVAPSGGIAPVGGTVMGPGAGTTGGTTKPNMNPTGTAGAASNPGAGAVAGTGTSSSSSSYPTNPTFETKVTISSNGCQATVTGTNKTVGLGTLTDPGTIADLAWGMKLNPDPTVYSGVQVNFSKVIDIYGKGAPTQGTLTLTTKYKNGKTGSLSKSVSLPTHNTVSVTSSGMTCK